MKILGIETSCDETAASVVQVAADKSHVTLLSTVTATSLHLHAETGGIIPEIAARNQIKDIIPVVYEALEKARLISKGGVTEAGAPRNSSGANGVSEASLGGGERQDPVEKLFKPDIDAIAVTYGPGLIGSLLVGVETAKALSYVWDIPLIPVNHLFGHVYANWIGLNGNFQSPTFPAIGLIISGGHTDLILMKSHTDVTWLGGTRDDAAGEAFDKIGRMLGIAYPAGPRIEQLAKQGNPKAFHFPRPLMYDKELDFSFSGLKTAVLREVEKFRKGVTEAGDPHRVPAATAKPSDGGGDRQDHMINTQTIADICRGVQDAISDVIVYKTLQAAEKYHVTSIVLGGGVAANETLKETFQRVLATKYASLNTQLFVPARSLCTDNASMIATAAILQGKIKPWQEITADPELYFD